MDKQTLESLYLVDGLSMAQIAQHENCSLHKISYWMNRHSITRRSRSDANYKLYNSDGDPFSFKDQILTIYVNSMDLV